jgi:aminoglycoside phosphotransferase (APT) family kinase protein
VLHELRREPGFERAALAEPLHEMQGGFWAATYGMRLVGVAPDRAALVLRIMPDDALAAKETAIQRGVATQGYPAPTVFLAGGRDYGLGGPFILMALASGAPLLAGLDGTRALRSLPTLLREMPVRLASAMASLHHLAAEPVREQLDRAPGSAPADIDSLFLHLSAAASGSADSVIQHAGRWLQDRRPPRSIDVVCHGDLHPFNMLVDAQDFSVLDWTASLIADAAYDVAFTALLLGHPPLDAPAPLRPVIATGGRYIARRFVTQYRSVARHDLDPNAMRWYTTLHSLRIALDLDAWRREGSLAQHRGHPWLAIEPPIRRRLESVQP